MTFHEFLYTILPKEYVDSILLQSKLGCLSDYIYLVELNRYICMFLCNNVF